MNYRTFKNKIKSLPLFSTSMLGALTEDVDTLRVQISTWKKKGLICSLRKGLYVLNPEEVVGCSLHPDHVADSL